MSSQSHSVEEIEVVLSITDGKLTAESRSGAKSGSVELSWDENRAKITLNGAGSDFGSATLTGPELSSFRTMIDAGLSSLVVGQDGLERDRRVLSSGYQTLDRFDDGVGVTLDEDALTRLGVLNERGEIAGGSRQVRCTVLNNGTAIVNLTSEAETEFNF